MKILAFLVFAHAFWSFASAQTSDPDPLGILVSAVYSIYTEVTPILSSVVSAASATTSISPSETQSPPTSQAPSQSSVSESPSLHTTTHPVVSATSPTASSSSSDRSSSLTPDSLAVTSAHGATAETGLPRVDAPRSGHGSKLAIILGCVLGALAFGLLILTFILCCRRRRRRQAAASRHGPLASSDDEIDRDGLKHSSVISSRHLSNQHMALRIPPAPSMAEASPVRHARGASLFSHHHSNPSGASPATGGAMFGADAGPDKTPDVHLGIATREPLAAGAAVLGHHIAKHDSNDSSVKRRHNDALGLSSPILRKPVRTDHVRNSHAGQPGSETSAEGRVGSDGFSGVHARTSAEGPGRLMHDQMPAGAFAVRQSSPARSRSRSRTGRHPGSPVQSPESSQDPVDIPPTPPLRSRPVSAIGTAAPAAAAYSYVNRSPGTRPRSSTMPRASSPSPSRQSLRSTTPMARRQRDRSSWSGCEFGPAPHGLSGPLPWPSETMQPHSTGAPHGLDKGIVGDNGYPHLGIPRRKSGGEYDFHAYGPLGPQTLAPSLPRQADIPHRPLTPTAIGDHATYRPSQGMPGGWQRTCKSLDGSSRFGRDNRDSAESRRRLPHDRDLSGYGQDDLDAYEGVGRAL